MAGQEKAPNTQLRALKPETSRHIILSLVGIGHDFESLDGQKASRLQGILHEHQRRTEDRIFFTEGELCLDFGDADGDDKAALKAIVARTSTALFNSDLFAEVSGAWIVAADSPPFEYLMTEHGQLLTDVTADAQTMFTDHQDKLLADVIDHFFVDVA
jgi:hypothetical protein